MTMTFNFQSCRRYVTRNTFNPRRRWLVYVFKTQSGMTVTLRQALVVRRISVNRLYVL